MNINTQQLLYFMELANCLNFTRAAANLYVAQPTLSQQIAELEAQLGVTLFNRNSRSVTLTPAGAILYASYPDLSARFQNMQQRMLVTAAGFSGSLTFGFLDIFLDLIPTIMRDFKTAFPEIAIKPCYANMTDLIKGLKNTIIDVALSVIPGLPAEEQSFFEAKEIARDSICLVLPEGQSIPTDPSNALPLIMLDESVAPGYYPHVMECLKKHGIPVSEVIFTDSLVNLWVYLESRSGFSVLAKMHAGFFPESTQFIPLPDEYLKLGVLWNTSTSNHTLPLFLDTLDQLLNPDSINM